MQYKAKRFTKRVKASIQRRIDAKEAKWAPKLLIIKKEIRS